MKRKSICAILLVGLTASVASADTIWLGSINSDWTNAGNWNAGVPGTPNPSQRANIESTTDLANWPTIHNGESVSMTQRIQAPNTVPAADGQTEYSRFTIEAGGSLSTTTDFRMAQNDPTAANRAVIGSLNVAGTFSVAGRLRIADSPFTTAVVNITGALSSTSTSSDFRFGNGGVGATGIATVDILGSGLASSSSASFQIGTNSLVRLSDNGTLTINANGLFTKPSILTLLTGYATSGRLVGLTDTYTGGQPLTPISNGVAYYEGTTSYSFVASTVPEPSTAVLCLIAATTIAARRRTRRA